MLAWSTVASAFKIALRHGDVFSLVFGASLTSAFTLTFLAFLQHRGRDVIRFSPNDLMGFLNPVAYYLVLLAAYDRLLAAHALAINYTWVLALALLGVLFLKQRFSPQLAVGLLLGYGGVFLVVAGCDDFVLGKTEVLGILLAFLSTWIWAVYWVYNARHAHDPLLSLVRQFMVGTAASGVLWLLFSRRMSLPGAAGAAYLGIMEMGLSFFTWLSALRLTRNAARLGALVFLSPVLSLVWISIFLQEPLNVLTFAGMGAILLGVAFTRWAPS